jgi:nitroreductase
VITANDTSFADVATASNGKLPAIALPPPRTEFGASLAQALRARCSVREYAPRSLSLQEVADLLWCAFGVNRPTSGDRTAPSWRHAIETELFLATAEGVWHYDAPTHRLLPRLSRDIRAETGHQEFVGVAPVELIYVASGERLQAAAGEDVVSPADKLRIASADAGFIGQNVALYCASVGLASVFRGSIDSAKVGRLLGLPAAQFVTFGQTVGYPAT